MKRLLFLLLLIGTVQADRIRHDSLFGLYQDDHRIYLMRDGTKPLQSDWNWGDYTLSGLGIDVTNFSAYAIDANSITISEQITSTVETGTAPFIIASTTLNTNLNADLWDGYQFSDYLDQTVKQASSPTFAGVTTNTLSTPGGAITAGVGATTIAATKSFHVVTGDAAGNTLATITGGTEGMVLRLLFVDALVTITDTDAHTADTIDLSAAFTSADDTVLTLIYDGTSWYETSRSVN